MEAKGRIICTIMAGFFSLTVCLIDIVDSMRHPRQVHWNKELLQDDTETPFISVLFLQVSCWQPKELCSADLTRDFPYMAPFFLLHICSFKAWTICFDSRHTSLYSLLFLSTKERLDKMFFFSSPKTRLNVKIPEISDLKYKHEVQLMNIQQILILNLQT